MTKLIRNVFISSKYRTNKSEKPYDFNVYFPQGYIECQEKQYMTVNIINFHMPNSMYNINDNNNLIYILIRDKITSNLINTYTYTLTNGNYNVYELRDHFNVLLSTYISVNYNKIRNTYTFNDNFNDVDNNVSILTSTGEKYLGLINNEEYLLNTSIESVQPVNLVSYNKIVLNCLGLDFNGTIENISNDDGFEISNILFWASRQDVSNMAELAYQNEDGGNSFNYLLYNKNINSLKFILTDEEYQPLTDLPDWTMVLQFTIEESPNNEIISILSVIQKYLLDIYSMIYLLMKSFRII